MNKAKKATLYIILASVLWGTSGLFVNTLAKFGFSSLQLMTARGLISALAMGVYVLIKDRSAFKTNWKDLLIFIAIGVCLFGTGTAYFIALQVTSVSTAVVLMYTAPIYVLIFSVLFLGEKLSLPKGLAVAGMLVGCCLVSGIIGGLKLSWYGFLMGILSGLAYGGYNILTKIEMRRKINPLSVTFYSFITLTVIALAASAPGEMIRLAAQKPLVTVPLLIGIGIVTFVLPYFLYTLGLRDLPAGTASALGIIEPMAATVFSVVILKETLTLIPFMGILLILASVFLLSKSED